MEAELDIDTVLSLAPKANIEVYEGGPTANTYTVFSQIVSDDTAKIVSASWTNGCEAYVGQAYQNSENTLFQAAAVDGQSIFVATGDEGAEGCNLNGVVAASTGTQPVAQVVDPKTGTLYIANKSSNTLSVDSEGTSGNPSSAAAEGSVTTGSGPDAVALDTKDAKVFVADSTSSSLTTFSTGTCNQGKTSGCATPTQDRLGRSPVEPDRSLGQRIDALRRQRQRHGGGVQREHQRLRHQGDPSRPQLAHVARRRRRPTASSTWGTPGP